MKTDMEIGSNRKSGTGPKDAAPFKKLRLFAGAAATASVIIIMMSYYLPLKNHKTGDMDYSSYKYHIAIISDETDTSFWRDVHSGAVEAGAEYGAYVEQIGDNLADRFSMEDAINIAIYEHVDGILLRPAGNEETQKLIDKACSRGIPVITMQKDVPGSKRQGFVGINDYFLGQEYGKRVLRMAESDIRLVTVLFPGAGFNETSRKWFRLGLSNTVQQYPIRFDFRTIQDDRGLNNAEDVIQDMAEGNAQQPDVIICLDEVLTQSAYQLIRDRGLSDRIRVIGSYISDEILEGIEQGYLDSTITVDPKAMGRLSVEALMTYKKYHMVSYYTEVGAMLVDQGWAEQYRGEGGDGEEHHMEK